EMSVNTEGSDFIKKILLDNKPGPVYIQLWGGTNTVARALKSIEEDYKNTPQWASIYKKVSEKAILYAVLDQDATYKKYVAVNWPDIKVMYNSAQFWSFAYAWPRVVPTEIRSYLQGKWFAENIKFNHGPLMSSYYLWGDGQSVPGDPDVMGDTAATKKAGRERYDFISEGDSPSYLFLIDVGLRSLEDASYGGWGGRMVQSKTNPNRWEDGKTVTDYNPYTKKEDDAYPQTRWIPALQNDFAARANWCVKDYKNANHPPVVKLSHSNNLTGVPGTKINLKGTATDPDKNELSYIWWQYKEAGSYNGDVELQNANTSASSFISPKDAKPGETLHIILEVSDSGTPKLTRYQRAIVTVK
ncbi:MAG TPA: nucleoside hydrolase-like domain-containing protein, partial [Mucilaginibacter sp.]